MPPSQCSSTSTSQASPSQVVKEPRSTAPIVTRNRTLVAKGWSVTVRVLAGRRVRRGDSS